MFETLDWSSWLSLMMVEWVSEALDWSSQQYLTMENDLFALAAHYFAYLSIVYVFEALDLHSWLSAMVEQDGGGPIHTLKPQLMHMGLLHHTG